VRFPTLYLGSRLIRFSSIRMPRAADDAVGSPLALRATLRASRNKAWRWSLGARPACGRELSAPGAGRQFPVRVPTNRFSPPARAAAGRWVLANAWPALPRGVSEANPAGGAQGVGVGRASPLPTVLPRLMRAVLIQCTLCVHMGRLRHFIGDIFKISKRIKFR
jgi:hypothetical protein